MVDGEPLHAPSPRFFLSSMPCFNLVLRRPDDLSVKHNFIDKSRLNSLFHCTPPFDFHFKSYCLQPCHSSVGESALAALPHITPRNTLSLRLSLDRPSRNRKLG